jgi:hypothetical protein
MSEEKSPISEYHYFEKFVLTEVDTLINFLNAEQTQHGRIIEIDAEEIRDPYRIFILRRLKFNASKPSFNVQKICNKKVTHHLKINDCDYALIFDLPTQKRKN